MGLWFSKKKQLYSRNEIMALNRDAEAYGINLKRYQTFCDTNNYKLAILTITNNDNTLDSNLINYWNKWKQSQSWGNTVKNLDKNCLTQLAYAPTKLNNSNSCPKYHNAEHISTLTKFYSLYSPKKNLDIYINEQLDNKRYHEIVDEIKKKYSETNWNLSQNLTQKWLDVIYIIKNSTHNEIKYLELVEEVCKYQSNQLLDDLNKRIII